MYGILRNIKIYHLLILISVFVLTSCQATNYLKKDEKFLHKNRIKFETDEKIENKIFLVEELKSLYEQEPNGSFLWVPRQWFYYVFNKKNNWFSRFVKRNFAQKPVIYNDKLTSLTSKKFQNFLRNSRGFYKCEVSFKTDDEKYITDVDYIIKTGKRYRINRVDYICDDEAILNLINKSREKTYLIKDNPVSSSNYEEEKIRITNLLQNNGYALFNKNYMELYGDSSHYKIDLKIKINNDLNGNKHKIYKIGKVDVYTDYYYSQNVNNLDTLKIGNVIFYRELDKFLVKPKILEGAIPLEKGELYRKDLNVKVYTKLTQFRIYKSVSIKTFIDSTEQNTINYKIYLSTQDNLLRHREQLDLNYVSFSSRKNYLEFGANGALFNRKLSSRGDYISFLGSGAIKINFHTTAIEELNATSKIDYTNPISPFTLKVSPIYLYNRLFRKNSYENFKNNAVTNSVLSYQYQEILDNLSLSSVNFSYGFKYSLNNRLSIISNQIGINYSLPEILNPKFFTTFQTKSLQKVFMSGLFLKNISFNYNSAQKLRLYNYSISIGMETSGLEIFLANKLYNSTFDNDEIWRISDKVSYAKFVKLSVDYQPQFKTGSNSGFAGRIFAGIGVPFGDSSTLPYSKLFEVGGPNSMRGWAARELGPGSYSHKLTSREFPYQKANIRIEGNLEYRFKISTIFKGALFTDIGNIWTLKEDSERIGSQFNSQFYNQLAVDAGFSLQLDLIILLRLDFAFKLRNSYKNAAGEYWTFNPNPTIVFAVNHPFAQKMY